MRCLLMIFLFVGAIGITGYQAFHSGWVRMNYPSIESFPTRGIDVSHHQGVIDWLQVRETGISFA